MQTRQYLLTERAHLMCPNMQFGIQVKLKADYDEKRFQEAMQALREAHPFLKSVIAREDGSVKYYYDVREDIAPVIIHKENAQAWMSDYQALNADGWDTFHEGLLRVIVYPAAEAFDVIFVAHHLLGDGRGILGMACEFADCYVEGKKPQYACEQLITSIKEFPQGSDLPFVSKMIINSANKNWNKENHAVSYAEYLDFEQQFIRENPTEFTEETVEAEKVQKMLDACHKASVTLNDYLVAQMMSEEMCNKVVIAADIRSELACYQKGALGNYATAMGIVSKAKTDDVMAKAKDVAAQIKAYRAKPQKLMLILACYLRMIPELIDAVPIATLGNYESKAGKFVGSAMFGYEKRDGYSVTNLGNIQNSNMLEAMFIPPVSPSNRKITGVVSVNGRMKKCSAVCGKMIST